MRGDQLAQSKGVVGFPIRSVFGFPPSPIRYMPGNIIRTNKQETNKRYVPKNGIRPATKVQLKFT